MNDERYVGTVKGIIGKKREAMDYVESMIPHFESARRSGYGANLTKYAVYFESEKSRTPTGKMNWHPTQVMKLMETDTLTMKARIEEAAKFDDKVAYFKGRSYRPVDGRKVTDREWDDLREEYFTFLDANVERAKKAAAKMRGEN